MKNPTDQKILRKTLRKQRLTLTKQQKKQLGFLATRQFSHLQHRFSNKKSAKVGVFIDAFGELPTQFLVNYLFLKGFEVYLPVVTHEKKPLSFVKITQQNFYKNRLMRHTFGMRQPTKGKKIQAKQLDIIIMPLVALDKKGNRLSMGGGFYDKSLANCKNKPVKIGWAYDFQLVEKLNVNAWDIGLDIAVLPSGLMIF